VFRRRRRDDEPENDLEPTDEETVADEESEDDDEPTVVTHGGPWDSEADSVPEMERVDFGAIQVPIGEGLEIRARGALGSPEEGQKLFDSALGWLALGKMMFGSEPWGEALGQLHLDRDGQDLTLRLALTAQEAELLLK